jgi:hypothetical protein
VNIDRKAIADVLTTVDGVTGYPYRPKHCKIGDAYPLIEHIDRVQGLMFIASWKVQMWLGPDEFKADEFLEQVAVPVAQALQNANVLYVTSVLPVALGTQGGDVLAAEFTGNVIIVDNALQGA